MDTKNTDKKKSKRHYTLRGKNGNTAEYPSVTTILDDHLNKPALMNWAVGLACEYVRQNIKDKSLDTIIHGENVQYIGVAALMDIIDKAQYEYKNISSEAMSVGTEVHQLAEDFSLGKTVNLTGRRDQVVNGYNAFLQWQEDNIAEFINAEQVVFSDKYQYAGTVDAIARLKDGRLAVIDYKTSKGFFEGYDLQLCAYASAWEEMNPKVQVEAIICLRLDKETGMPHSKDYTKNRDRLTSCWENLASAWWLHKKRRLKAEGDIVELADFSRSDEE